MTQDASESTPRPAKPAGRNPAQVKRLSGMLIISLFLSIGGFMFLPVIGPLVGVILGFVARKRIRLDKMLIGPRFAIWCIMIGFISLGFQGYQLYRAAPLIAFQSALGSEQTGFLSALEGRDHERMHDLMSKEYREGHSVADMETLVSAAFPGDDSIPIEGNVETNPPRSVDAIRFTPGADEVVLASTSFFNPAFRWTPDGDASPEPFGWDSKPLSHVGFSRDGLRMAAASLSGKVTIWTSQHGDALSGFEGHDTFVTASAFFPSGDRVLSGTAAGVLKVWTTADGGEKAVLAGHKAGILAVAVSPDSKRALTSAADRTVILWDLAAAQSIRTFSDLESNVRVLGFLGDGSRIYMGIGAKLRILNAATGENTKDLLGHEKRIRAAATSRDGRRMLTGSADDTVRLWNTETGEQIALIGTHGDDVTAVAFSDDGTRAVSGADDLHIKVWDLIEEREIASLSAGDTDNEQFNGRFWKFAREGGDSWYLPWRYHLEYGDETVELTLCYLVTRESYLDYEPEIVGFYTRNLDRLFKAPGAAKGGAGDGGGGSGVEEDDPR